MITTNQCAEGTQVRFPFALKDQFKQVFPSARWQPDERCWIVGTRSAKRLAQWIDAAVPTVSAIETAEEGELSERQLAEVRAQLTTLRARIEEARDSTRSLEALAEALKSDRAAIAAASAEVEAVKAERRSAESAALTLLAGLIDIDALEDAREVMRHNHRPADRSCKQRFEAARMIACEQRNALAAAGWRSAGISTLADANVNRPDRDAVDDVSREMILRIVARVI